MLPNQSTPFPTWRPRSYSLVHTVAKHLQLKPKQVQVAPAHFSHFASVLWLVNNTKNIDELTDRLMEWRLKHIKVSTGVKTDWPLSQNDDEYTVSFSCTHYPEGSSVTPNTTLLSDPQALSR